MSSDSPADSGRRGGGGEVGDGVALVDRLRAEAPPRRQRDHRQPLDQPHDRAERARARADHDRRAQRDARRDGVAQDPLDLGAAREVRGRAPADRAAARRGRRSAATRRAAAAAAKRRAAARSRSTKLAEPPPAPSSGSGSRRPRCPRARGPGPRPMSASPRTQLDARGRVHARGVARERAQLVGARERARASAAPTAPLVPVIRIRIAPRTVERLQRALSAPPSSCPEAGPQTAHYHKACAVSVR